MRRNTDRLPHSRPRPQQTILRSTGASPPTREVCSQTRPHCTANHWLKKRPVWTLHASPSLEMNYV